MNLPYRSQNKAEHTRISHKTKHSVQVKLAKFELIQALACYGIASLCMLGGITLIGMGVTGAIEIFIGKEGIKATLANLSPGAFLFLIGIGIAWFGRYQFKHHDQ